ALRTILRLLPKLSARHRGDGTRGGHSDQQAAPMTSGGQGAQSGSIEASRPSDAPRDELRDEQNDMQANARGDVMSTRATRNWQAALAIILRTFGLFGAARRLEGNIPRAAALDHADERSFVLRVVQPGLAGLMDGSVST